MQPKTVLINPFLKRKKEKKKKLGSDGIFLLTSTMHYDIEPFFRPIRINRSRQIEAHSNKLVA